MENLRWILLAAGIFFILAIYFVGRQRHRHNNNSDLFDSKEELPEFSARDWDDLDEGVGEVRVVASDDYGDDFSDDQVPLHDSEIMPETYESETEDNHEPELVTSDDLFVLTDEVDEPLVEQPVENNDTKSEQPKSSSVDIIVLYILAKPSEVLTGEKINSVAQANGFVFGSMNIYHCHDANGQTIFSLANMMEPGNFDPDSIHEMTTSGLTVFMQLSNLTQPTDDFDEMLRSAYHMSEMLGASLCNQNRQPFTQADAEYYRSLIAEIENA
ncbi:MAG: cell division protein ZipA [Gammaproteobacteria bacterium]|nr:cell division protein ZipA [Gammaproteobacteria bacterium]